jgi:DNA invertase Pin-like site-specific DNA recombinase
MNAIAYVRVSTDSQADSGAGLAAQIAAINTYAKRAGLTITATHQDAGISGAARLEDRPGLVAAIAGLRRGDVLLVAKRDRLGRDVLNVMMAEKVIAKRGASVVSADGVGNGDGAADVFMRSVMDAAAAFERDLIKARTKAALAAKRAAGERVGEVPFGWTLDAAGRLVEVYDEQIILGRIMACRAAGMSLRKIAGILTADAVPTKKGNTSWSHTSIASILERAAALAA